MTEPVRKIRDFGGRKNRGKFPSAKTGRTACYESLNERDFMYLLDYDRGVRHWIEQPLRFRIVLNGQVRYYTPDFEVHRTSGKQIVEVKPLEKLDGGEWDALFRAASAICGREGYEFVVVTDAMIREQPRLDNVKRLWKYARTPVRRRHLMVCLGIFRREGASEIGLGKLIRLCGNEGVPPQVVYALIFLGKLSVDITRPIDLDSPIRPSADRPGAMPL